MKKAKVMVAAIGLFCLFWANWAGATERLVLAESFTNTSWGSCHNADLVLDQLTENYPDTVACIRYHVWWPGQNDPYYQYNISEIIARTNYYGVTGVPNMKVDGYISAGAPGSYWTIIQNRYYMEPPIEITLDGSFDEESRTGSLDITITAVDYAYFDELFVRIALTESDLYYRAPNGSVWHHQTMRDMIPNALGTSIEIDYGQTVELTRAFSVPAPLVIDNCKLIVWLQSDYMKEIYQTAEVNVADLGAVDIDDNVVDLPGTFSLAQNYPNPFNATTSIIFTLNEESLVNLAVYDLAGRKVSQLVNGIENAGEHQVIWDGLDNNGQEVSTGIYFYRLEANDQTETRRMVLLK